MSEALILDAGRVDYVAALELQRELHAARVAGRIPDVVFSVEHDSVVTRGTRTEDHEVALAEARGIPVVQTERGGKATWHGPGQAVAYPIFDLNAHGKDVKRLVCKLEAAVIDTLDLYGIAAWRRAGYPGVWVGTEDAPRKIASLGLRVREWVSFHGLALNVVNDLEPFTWFTPCGIADVEMTTVAAERRRAGAEEPDFVEVREALLNWIAYHFDLDLGTPLDVVAVRELLRRTAPPASIPLAEVAPVEREHARESGSKR